jgi:hypothetical protein
MPDELHTFSHTELETHGMKDVWVSAGFTLADVLELYRDWHGNAYDPKSPEAERIRAKWAAISLLKEKNDAT